MKAIETDYLVIGAGAAGMSFTDALIDADQDCDVVMVDRRHAPGGHWNDAYPFVRLHRRPRATASTRGRWATIKSTSMDSMPGCTNRRMACRSATTSGV